VKRQKRTTEITGEFSGLLLGFGMRERMSAMRIYAAELVAPIRNLHPGTGNCF